MIGILGSRWIDRLVEGRLLILNVGHGRLIDDMRPAGVHALCVRILGPRLLASLPSFILIGSCVVGFMANC